MRSPRLISGFCLCAALVGEATAQGVAQGPSPTLTVGLASGQLEPTCSGCGAYRVRSNRVVLASLDLPLAHVPAAFTLRGLLFNSNGRQLGTVALGVEGMLLGRWVRVGAGIGAGECRDSVLAVIPPNGPARPTWASALAPMAEFHATAALPLLRHLELGPVVGFVTSLGGFTAFPITSDRALLYWGLEVTLH